MKSLLFRISSVLLVSLFFFGCKDNEPEFMDGVEQAILYNLITDTREIYMAGFSWSKSDIQYVLKQDTIYGKEYLRMYKKYSQNNHQPVPMDVYIRVEKDKIYGLDLKNDQEFLMYDFNKKLSNSDDFEITLFYEPSNGVVETIKFHPDYNQKSNRIDGNILDESQYFIKNVIPEVTYKGIAYFEDTRQKLIIHKMSFISDCGHNLETYYIEQVGLMLNPLYVNEESLETFCEITTFHIPDKSWLRFCEYMVKDKTYLYSRYIFVPHD